jgi:predicted permease
MIQYLMKHLFCAFLLGCIIIGGMFAGFWGSLYFLRGPEQLSQAARILTAVALTVLSMLAGYGLRQPRTRRGVDYKVLRGPGAAHWLIVAVILVLMIFCGIVGVLIATGGI